MRDVEFDPMENDYEDPEGFDRKTYLLKTKNFGNIFIRSSGNE